MALSDWTASAPMTTHYEIVHENYTLTIDYEPSGPDDDLPWCWRIEDDAFEGYLEESCAATAEEAAHEAESTLMDIIAETAGEE